MVIPDQGKWGIMGGIFDPIHYGHLRLAETAREYFGLDKVLFLVSVNPPHRNRQPAASFEDRLQMTQIALRNSEIFKVSDIENDIDGPHYTVNIIAELKARYPQVEWHLILGADNVAIFDTWHKPEEIIKQVKVAVGSRPGYEITMLESVWKDKIEIFDMQNLGISSTMIRNLISGKKSIKYLTPDDVANHIEERKLYQ